VNDSTGRTYSYFSEIDIRFCVFNNQTVVCTGTIKEDSGMFGKIWRVIGAADLISFSLTAATYAATPSVDFAVFSPKPLRLIPPPIRSG
jgi:hypothetical protein